MIGRAGRDNQPSTVLLYSKQEAANKGLNPKIRDVVTSTTCQRVAILRALDAEEVVEPNREGCCTKCTGSEQDPNSYFVYNHPGRKGPSRKRPNGHYENKTLR